MTDHRWDPSEKISGIEVAEIKTLMLVKEVNPQQLQRVLDSKGVETLEQLDTLTARNFLHYLRSL
jgi:hypothetical protein